MKINKRPERQKSKRIWQFFIFGCSYWAMCALLFLFSACGKSARKETDYPLPRHMQVMSMERAHNLYSEENLIINGDFTLWDVEGQIPEAFSVPKDRAISYIIQRDDRGGPGQHSADQYWHKSDVGTSPRDLFHTVVADVQGGGVYELNVHARTYDDTTADVSVFVLDSTGTPVAAYLNAITVESGRDEFRTHSCKLKADSGGTWLIASHTNENTRYRGRIIWLEWRLTESSAIVGDILQAEPFSQR